MSPALTILIEKHRHYRMTEAELEAQLISFAYGNVAIDCPGVTREIVEQEARKLACGKSNATGKGEPG